MTTKIEASRVDVEHDLRIANETAMVYRGFADALTRAGNIDEASRIDARRMAIWQAWNRRLPGNPLVARRLAELQPAFGERR